MNLRSAIDRWRHPARHRNVRERLAQIGRPRHILVVCHANICRSPYLEAELRRLLPDVHITSAGFMTSGRAMPDVGQTVATRRGLDLSQHRSRALTPDMFRATDLVIVMDARQARYLIKERGLRTARVIVAGDLDPLPSETRAIQDPWGQSAEVFESSFARLARVAKNLEAFLTPADEPLP